MPSSDGTQDAESEGTFMNDRVVTLATAVTLLTLVIVGFIDALRDDNTGAAVLFAIIFVGVLSLSRSRTRPPPRSQSS